MFRLPQARWAHIALVALILVAPASARAQDDPPATGTRVADPFAPLPPSPEDEPDDDDDEDTGTSPTRDRIYIEDGSLLEGRLKGYRNDKLIIKSSIIGEVKVKPENVVRFSLERERAFYIQTQPGKPSESIIVSVGSDGQLVYRLANARSSSILDFETLEEMRDVPIPTEVWTIVAGLTGSIDVGNSDAVNFGVEASMKRESKIETFEMKGGFSFAETDGDVSRRLITGNIVYRYFFSDTFGAFVEDDIRKDSIAGIRLRNRVNAGGTWRPLSELDLKLAFDLGFNYTFESLVDGDDSDFLGAVAKLDYQHDIDSLQLRAEARFNIDLFDTSGYTLETKIEVRVAIDSTLIIGVRAEDTWNGRTSAGTKRNDLRVVGLLTFEFKSD